MQQDGQPRSSSSTTPHHTLTPVLYLGDQDRWALPPSVSVFYPSRLHFGSGPSLFIIIITTASAFVLPPPSSLFTPPSSLFPFFHRLSTAESSLVCLPCDSINFDHDQFSFVSSTSGIPVLVQSAKTTSSHTPWDRLCPPWRFSFARRVSTSKGKRKCIGVSAFAHSSHLISAERTANRNDSRTAGRSQQTSQNRQSRHEPSVLELRPPTVTVALPPDCTVTTRLPSTTVTAHYCARCYAGPPFPKRFFFFLCPRLLSLAREGLATRSVSYPPSHSSLGILARLICSSLSVHPILPQPLSGQPQHHHCSQTRNGWTVARLGLDHAVCGGLLFRLPVVILLLGTICRRGSTPHWRVSILFWVLSPRLFV